MHEDEIKKEALTNEINETLEEMMKEGTVEALVDKDGEFYYKLAEPKRA